MRAMVASSIKPADADPGLSRYFVSGMPMAIRPFHTPAAFLRHTVT